MDPRDELSEPAAKLARIIELLRSNGESCAATDADAFAHAEVTADDPLRSRISTTVSSS